VVPPDRDQRVVGQSLSFEIGHELGHGLVEEVHRVEEVAKRCALPATDVEFLEVFRKALEGVVEGQGQEIGGERPLH